MSDRVFVDTNILIYAHDVDAGVKHTVAVEVLRDLWDSNTGAISTQVLQEFYVNATRKIPTPLPRAVARDIIEQYSVWEIVQIDVALIHRASEMEERHQLSFWDALIIAAARETGAARLFSEDLNSGQLIEGIRIENPLSH